MSAAAVVSSVPSCSGAMYAGVPKASPVPVTDRTALRSSPLV